MSQTFKKETTYKNHLIKIVVKQHYTKFSVVAIMDGKLIEEYTRRDCVQPECLDMAIEYVENELTKLADSMDSALVSVQKLGFSLVD